MNPLQIFLFSGLGLFGFFAYVKPMKDHPKRFGLFWAYIGELAVGFGVLKGWFVF